MNDIHLVMHGVAIKKHATPEAVATVVGLEPFRTQALLADLTAQGRVVETKGKYALTPAARIALEAEYSLYYGALRANTGFIKPYEDFERINVSLKTLITDWQTIPLGGERIPNHHGDRDYDRRVIDRLGALHERVDVVLAELVRRLPRLQTYRDKLLTALENAESGALEWVSDARTESYHSVWFELHEDLLRVMGTKRTE